MTNFSEAFGKIWQGCTVGSGVCLEGPEVLYQSDSPFPACDGVEGVVELASDRLYQTLFEPSHQLALDGFSVGLRDPWLLGVDWLVCLHLEVMPGLPGKTWLRHISLQGIKNIAVLRGFYLGERQLGCVHDGTAFGI
jgi:hypothetical protein